MKCTSLKKVFTVGTVLTVLLSASACANVKTTPEPTLKDDEAAPVQTEYEQLQAQLAQLENELADVEAERDTLQTQLRECESALSQAQSDLAEALARQDEFQNRYKLYKNVCSQDEIEQTLFGQPISEERNGEYRIGVKTAVDGDYHATLSIYQAQNGKYVEVFSCDALVGKNGPGKQVEGDYKTPLGTWTIGEAYGIKKNPGSLLPYTQVKEDMYWCATGSNGKKYNTLLYKRDDPDNDYSKDEHLIDYTTAYAYFLDLGYNAPGAPYAGNAIFLHCWSAPDHPTSGCVAVSEESMVKILQTVTPGTSATIY